MTEFHHRDTSVVTHRQLRSFGLLVGSIWAVIALWPAVFRGQHVRWWAAVLGAALVIPAAVAPGLLRYPHRIWMGVGHALGWVNTKIILTAMFFLVFAPIGKLMRMIRRDPMHLRFDPSLESYRIMRQPRAPSHMKHLY